MGSRQAERTREEDPLTLALSLQRRGDKRDNLPRPFGPPLQGGDCILLRWPEAGVGSLLFTLCFLPLKRNERLDDIVRLGRHHSERGLDLRKGKPMGGQRRGVNAPVLKQPQ